MTHEKLDDVIKSYANVDKVEIKEKNHKNKKENNKLKVMLIIAIISIIGNAVFFSLYLVEKNKIKEKEVFNYEECDNDITTYTNKDIADQIIYGMSGNPQYFKDKLLFMDTNIVFVIEEFGDYYYDYDCMMHKVGNNRYSYLAYNKEAAISKGYREGSCR